MTLLEMVTEVIARCGEGYGSYATRAKAAIRAGMAQAISSGLIPIEEIDGTIKVENIVDVEKEFLDEYTFDLNTEGVAGMAILYTRVEIDQRQGDLYFTKVASKEMLNQALHYRKFNIACASSSYKEVLYYIELPYIYIKLMIPLDVDISETLIFSYRLIQVGVAVTAFTTDATQFNAFINEKFQQIIIDIAAKNLVSEINR